VDRKMLPKPVTLSADKGMNGQLPSTKGQKLVASVWGKILGVNNIKIKDDFFELGGHSLLAVEVMTQLERETRKRLPLNSLFRYPNLEEFAELFEEEKTPDKKDESWSCLVPIKPSGSKPPLYLIHGAGSNVGTFFVLAKKVDADQPVFGLQAKGLNGIDEPFSTIPEMASHYIEEIIRHNPDGPYHIGGQSFGGYVAFEMAKQMKQMNKDVTNLLLFDIDAYQSETELSRWQKLGKKVTNELQKRFMDIKLLLNHREIFMRQKRSSMERKKLKLTGVLKGNKINADIEIAQVIEKIRKINHQAMDNYIMSPYDGDIYLFKAKIPIFYIREKKYYGWRPYVNNLYVIDVDGDHNSMFEQPLVEELGKKVQKILND
jgi:thioesterase domain-containing protein/acyl carrier protein